MSENQIIQIKPDYKEKGNLEKKQERGIDILEIEFEDKLEEQKSAYEISLKDKKKRRIMALQGQQKAKKAALMARDLNYSLYGYYHLR